MSWLIPLFLVLHLLAAIGWVGGMLFAHVALRPSAMALEPPVRLALWQRVFSRFFPLVWLCVITLLVTGHGLTGMGAGRGSHPVMLMTAIGNEVALVFIFQEQGGLFKKIGFVLEEDGVSAANKHPAIGLRDIITEQETT